MRQRLAITAMLSLAAAPFTFAQSYNAGKHYPNPAAGTVAFEAARKQGPCGDPWVTLAQQEVYGSATPQRCDIKLYNNGKWDSYNALVHAMAKVKGGGSASAPSYPKVDLSTVRYVTASPGVFDLFTNDGMQIGRMVAAGGGNITVSLPPQLVAAGGGNVIGQNTASMVAAGGGNLVGAINSMLAQNPPIAPLKGYALQGASRLNDLKTRK